LAALRYRLIELKADRIIVVTDSGQSEHFQKIDAAGRDIGWFKDGQRLEHIGFGTINGEDGKKLKTRTGENVRLVDLLDEAVLRMKTILNERIEKGESNINVNEVHEVAEAIGYGAVKYFDMCRNPLSSYKFSFDRILSTKGDTAVYLLFTCARLHSIVANAATQHGIVVEDILEKVLQSPSPINMNANWHFASSFITIQ